MLTGILAFLATNSLVTGAVSTLIVNQVVRMLPIKPNSIIDLAAHLMVKLGQAILDRGASADEAAAASQPAQPAAIAAVQPKS